MNLLLTPEPPNGLPKAGDSLAAPTQDNGVYLDSVMRIMFSALLERTFLFFPFVSFRLFNFECPMTFLFMKERCCVTVAIQFASGKSAILSRTLRIQPKKVEYFVFFVV